MPVRQRTYFIRARFALAAALVVGGAGLWLLDSRGVAGAFLWGAALGMFGLNAIAEREKSA